MFSSDPMNKVMIGYGKIVVSKIVLKYSVPVNFLNNSSSINPLDTSSGISGQTMTDVSGLVWDPRLFNRYDTEENEPETSATEAPQSVVFSHTHDEINLHELEE